MSNKLLLTFALIGVIVVFSCGLLLPMPIGFKVSMITAGVMMIVMFSIIIPFDRNTPKNDVITDTNITYVSNFIFIISYIEQ